MAIRLISLLLGSMIAGLLVLTSCQPTMKKDAVDPDNSVEELAKPFFEPQPQLVAKRETVPTLAIGAKAPAFNLPGVDGKFHALDEFRDAKVLVVIFTCNHCPTAQAYEQRMIKFTEDYRDKGVQVVAISPNSPLGLLYEELGYTDLNDDFDDMVLRAEYLKYNFPYLYDGDDEKVSLQYGPVATPHAFVFDQDRRLQYQGRLDGVEKPGRANAEDLRNATDAVLAGQPVATPTTKVFGCSTKWGWKTEYKEKIDKEWKEKEVTLKSASVEGIKDLVSNKDGSKLRLINVWATWCGPCIIEYPEFIILQRMYGARDFEFISISADKPSAREKALAFLSDKNSAVPNFIFDQDDKYALIEAVDPDWNGALPYTLLVDPKGQKVWSHQGEVDFLELKRVIVDHPMIGRYF